MRSFAAATALLLFSSLVPSFAQNEANSPAVSQPRTSPVQPERTPQQSEQSRDRDRQRAEDMRVDRNWRAYPSDNDRGPMPQGRMSERMGDPDSDHRTVGRDWRARPDDDRTDRGGYGRDNYDDARPQRRVKVCFEYENGDEYCHYR
jgi:hypothetical protein